MNNVIKISKMEYERLVDAAYKLQLLENAGVYNWQHFDDALTEWYKARKEKEVIKDFLQRLDDTLAEADVEMDVAGYGTGHRITYDTDSIEKFLYNFYRELKALDED